jgi:hypothetical protein
MFDCHVCGNKTARDEYVSEVFTIESRRRLLLLLLELFQRLPGGVFG